MKNKIEYWSKHQELDKFNISHDTSLFLGHVAIILSVFFILNEFVKFVFLERSDTLGNIVAVLIIALSILIIWYAKEWESRIKEHNNHFMAREKMIRYWYDNLKKNKVNTDQLDRQIVKIMEIPPSYTGRKLRKKVKEIMKKVK